MLAFPLTLRFLTRGWRSGEMTLLFLALVIGVTSVSTLNHFTSMVKHQLHHQTSQMLGADVVVTSKLPIPDIWTIKAKALGLTQSSILNFPSMVEYKGNLQLAQIKSIGAGYPLRGELNVSSSLYGDAISVTNPPKPGHIWSSARLFPLLGIQVGDTISIGAAKFIVDGVLVDEPGQTGDWFNIASRIIMNQRDVSKTAVVQKGSNITWNWLLAGSDTHLLRLKSSLGQSIKEQQWIDSNKTDSINPTTERTLAYLNIGTLMSLILAGVAISMASIRYSKRFEPQVALLRCFGASQHDIWVIYLGGLLILGTVASLIGVCLGYALQPLLIHWLRGLLLSFDAPFSLKPALLSFGSGMLALLCFTLVNVWKLRKVTAINIFRKQQQNYNAEAAIGYGLALLLLGGLAYLYTGSFFITAVILLGCLFYVVLAVGILAISSVFMTSVKRFIPLSWYFGFTHIERNLANSTLQVVGIGLALTAILGLSLLKDNLLHDWKLQLPNDAANFFIINIEPNQVSSLTNFLNNNAIKSAMVYPMVKGRLTTINHLPVQQVIGTRANQINALRRDLNFSWAEQLPPGNTLVAGQWGGEKLENWISIEQGLAEELGVNLGDQLGVKIGDEYVVTKITSIRAVNWANFKPNFFIMFKPGILNHLPQTFITSIYLTDEQQNKLPALVKQFPNITILDVASIIKKIQTIFVSAGKAITLISIFSLLTGLIIAILAMLSVSEIKLNETYVLKVLGMRWRSLMWIRNIESCIIGFYAGLLAILCATYMNYYLNSVLFKLSFDMPWTLIITVPFVTAAATVLMNTLITLSQYQQKGDRIESRK